MEPYPRQDHFSAAVGQNLYIFGGAEDENTCVHWFDVSKDTWELREFEPPPPDTDSFQWKQLYDPQDCISDAVHGGPMSKVGCGMVSYENQIVLFGGYGIPSGPIQEGSEFIKHDKFKDGRGWTNEMHIFDMKKGLWSSPAVVGTRPPPLSRFSFTMVDKQYAVLFGGYGRPKSDKKDSVYILDLAMRTWSELKKNSHSEDSWPAGRDNHAAVSLKYEDTLSKLLIIGGLDKRKMVLDDMWIFDLLTKKWKKLKPPISMQLSGLLQPRCKHSATAYSLTPGLIEVTIFGGCSQWPNNYKAGAKFPVMGKTTVLRLEYQAQDGDWKLVAAVANGQLGSEQRISEKKELLTSATTCAQSSPPSHLTMENHYCVTQYLRDLNTKSLLAIGGALGLYYPHMCKMEPLMEEMVAAWLNKEDNVSPDPTWEVLVKALKQADQTGLAERVMKEKVLPPS